MDRRSRSARIRYNVPILVSYYSPIFYCLAHLSEIVPRLGREPNAAASGTGC